MPTSQDMAIFVLMTTMTTRLIALPLMHSCGVITKIDVQFL